MQYAVLTTWWENADMQSYGVPTTWPRPPFWMRVRLLPEWLTAFIMAATTIVGLLTYLWELRTGLPVAAIFALALGALACIASWRFRWITVLLSAAATFTASISGVNPIVEWNLVIFATFALILRGNPLWLSAIPSFTSYFSTAFFFGSVQPVAPQLGYQDALVAGGCTVLFAVIAKSVLIARQYWAQMHLRSQELSIARDIAVAKGVVEERLRIARDLHDVIGHEIAGINMHIGAAEVTLKSDNDPARKELLSARQNIQNVLSETQNIIKVLRTSDEPSVNTADSFQHGYSAIPLLIEHSQNAGLDVEFLFPEKQLTLTLEVDQASFRVVQECLTNATKYGSGSVALHISVHEAQLHIECVNRREISAAEERSPGYGLIGMRERVASVQGTMDVNNEDGLFWVYIRLPLAGGPAKTERGIQ